MSLCEINAYKAIYMSFHGDKFFEWDHYICFAHFHKINKKKKMYALNLYNYNLKQLFSQYNTITIPINNTNIINVPELCFHSQPFNITFLSYLFS